MVLAIPLTANYLIILSLFLVTFIFFERAKLFSCWIQGLSFNVINCIKKYVVGVGPDGSRGKNNWLQEGDGCSHAVSFSS